MSQKVVKKGEKVKIKEEREERGKFAVKENAR